MTKLIKRSYDMKAYTVRGVYVARIARTISEVEKVLCPCRLDILKIKWKHWLDWYAEYGLKMCRMSKQEIALTVNAVEENYKKEIMADSALSKPLFESFLSIHSIIITEFLHQIFEEYPDGYLSGVDFVGALLLSLAQNSVFEMAELKVPCHILAPEEDKCSFEREHGFKCQFHEDNFKQLVRPQFAIIVNDMFNINSFATKKLEYLYQNVIPKEVEVELILDFSHYETFNRKKIKRLLILAKQLYPKISISGAKPNVIALLDEVGPEYKRVVPSSVDDSFSTGVPGAEC